MSIRRFSILSCLCLAAALTGSGCVLYFGPEEETYSYCDSSGCYQCDDFGCWCVDGSCGGDGYYCTTDSQCAAGCYCDEYGFCAEAGYCTSDAECGPGFLCDEARNSCDPDGGSNFCSADDQCAQGSYCDEVSGACVPSWTCTENWECGDSYECINGTCAPSTCDSDTDCAAGCYCDPSQPGGIGGCAESCYCSSDAEAQAGGFNWCDEVRSTCMPGTDPNRGTCAGEVTCNLGAPTCAAGQVPLILNGCYSGECIALEQCEAAPVCEVLNTEAQCLAGDSCYPVYNGTNCTNGSGSACQPGDSGCTCASYSFDECRTDAP